MTAQELMDALDDAIEAFRVTEDFARFSRDVANINYLARTERLAA